MVPRALGIMSFALLPSLLSMLFCEFVVFVVGGDDDDVVARALEVTGEDILHDVVLLLVFVI